MIKKSQSVNKRVSVIIPTFRDDVALKRLLRQLSALDVFEIIIVDGEGRWSLPAHLSAFKAVQWKAAPRGRGPQIAHGLACATGDYLWVVHTDSQLHADSLQEIAAVLAQPDVSLGMFRLKFNAMPWAYRLFEFFAKIDTPLTSFGDQGFFFRRTDIDEIWSELCPILTQALILEDVILRQELKSLGRVKKSRLTIGTSPRRFQQKGLWRTQMRNAVILLRARFGTPIEQLYYSYYGTHKSALNTELNISELHPSEAINA